ncbi:MAG TPA: hypothetical protein V6C58_08805, partial [Allocoleopsis sp.]
MTESIIDLVDNLPTDNITVKVLNALDAIVPGKWENRVGFNNTIRSLTGITDMDQIKKIRDQAMIIYDNKNEGYQTAVWLYQTIDNMDNAIAAAAIADKVGDTFKFIPFLEKLTPKADSVQTGDFSLKLVGELVAYSKMNKVSIKPVEFATSLKENYKEEALMRMIALVCFDGLIPLGADFLDKVKTILSQNDPNTLQNNPLFKNITNVIPADDKVGFINNTFNSVSGWMNNLITSTGLTPTTVLKGLNRFIEIADDKLDYVAAF